MNWHRDSKKGVKFSGIVVKQRFIIGILIIAIILMPTITPVSADGGFFPRGYRDIYQPSQKAVIIYDDTEEKEELILQVKYEQGAEDFAWVVPVPDYPEVNEADAKLFEELHYLTAQRYGGFRGGGGVGRAGRPGVELLERKKVGIYDVSILSATDPSALVQWLNENGYNFPEEAESIVDFYIAKKWYFVAMRIDLEVEKRDILNAFKKIDSRIDTAEDAKKYLPELVADDIAECRSYKESALSKLAMISGNEEKFGEYKQEYEQLFIKYWIDGHRNKSEMIHALTYDGHWSDGHWYTYYQHPHPSGIMRDINAKLDIDARLKEGTIQPVKLSFNTTQIVYPLKITSLNPGYTEVLLYVFADCKMMIQNFTVEYIGKISPEDFWGNRILRGRMLAGLRGRNIYPEDTTEAKVLKGIITKPYTLTKLRKTFYPDEIVDDLIISAAKEEPTSVIFDWPYLFSIDATFKDDLNNGIISDNFKAEFKTAGYELSDSATVKKGNENEWVLTCAVSLLTDGMFFGSTEFVIRKEGKKLNIYWPTYYIGDKLPIKGRVNSDTATTLDIAIDGIVIPELNDVPIDENSEFCVGIDSTTTILNAFKIQECVMIEAFIDRHDRGVGVVGLDEYNDGQGLIWRWRGFYLRVPTGTVAKGEEILIDGAAVGLEEVEIITIAPGGAGENGLRANTGTDYPGITYDKVPVTDHTFSKKFSVSANASEGNYWIIVSHPGSDGVYGITGKSNIIDAISQQYYKPEYLLSKTHIQIVNMVYIEDELNILSRDHIDADWIKVEDEERNRDDAHIYIYITPTPSPTVIPSSSPSPNGGKAIITGGHGDIYPPAPTTPAQTPVTTPETEENGTPGFEVVFAIAGLLAVAYILRRHRE